MFFDKNKKNFQLFENENTVAVSKENWEQIELRRQSFKKYALFYNEADEKVDISGAPSIFHEFLNGTWVCDDKAELLNTKASVSVVLKKLDELYLKKKDGAFAVDMTDTVKNLNVPGKTDILFPTSQPSFNITNTTKPATCQNQKIVDYATNTTKYKDHDRCVIWVQDSRDIQSLVSLGHVLAADWALRNNSSIFDYIHYQQIGISGIQYNATQIRTAQPDGYPIVLDKHSLRMWILILKKINEQKEQLHGRYLLLKTQMQNCTTMDSLESVVKNMSTGWVDVFSDTETPAGMTVIR